MCAATHIYFQKCIERYNMKMKTSSLQYLPFLKASTSVGSTAMTFLE